MRKIVASLSFFVGFILLSNQVMAKWSPPKFNLPNIPDGASIVSLGEAIDFPSGKKVTGYMFIHYKNKPARNTIFGFSPKQACYGFLATGAKWKTVEPWIVNPNNTRGLSGDFVFQNISKDIGKWENAADGKVDSKATYNILGDGSLTDQVLSAETKSPDGQNEVYFAKINQAGVIAITTIWGYFSGSTSKRQLIEWDQVYNDTDYDWSMSGEASKMDFENIATHELGHSVGLDDQYNSSCKEVTMYGYASNGETKKQSLETQDILGISTLY